MFSYHLYFYHDLKTYYCINDSSKYISAKVWFHGNKFLKYSTAETVSFYFCFWFNSLNNNKKILQKFTKYSNPQLLFRFTTYFILIFFIRNYVLTWCLIRTALICLQQCPFFLLLNLYFSNEFITINYAWWVLILNL